MYARMFLLALGWRTHDPYERQSARAVRLYLIWLLVPVSMSLLAFMGVGYALTRDIRFAVALTLCIVCAAVLASLFGILRQRMPRKIVKTLVPHAFQSGGVRRLLKKKSNKKINPALFFKL